MLVNQQMGHLVSKPGFLQYLNYVNISHHKFTAHGLKQELHITTVLLVKKKKNNCLASLVYVWIAGNLVLTTGLKT